jgi:hypothetical protein
MTHQWHMVQFNMFGTEFGDEFEIGNSYKA